MKLLITQKGKRLEVDIWFEPLFGFPEIHNSRSFLSEEEFKLLTMSYLAADKVFRHIETLVFIGYRRDKYERTLGRVRKRIMVHFRDYPFNPLKYPSPQRILEYIKSGDCVYRVKLEGKNEKTYLGGNGSRLIYWTPKSRIFGPDFEKNLALGILEKAMEDNVDLKKTRFANQTMHSQDFSSAYLFLKWRKKELP